MKAKQPLLFLVSSICIVLLFYIMSLPINALGGESQIVILPNDTSYCNTPTFPFPLEIFPNYNASEQFDVKHEIKDFDGANRSIRQFRVRATLYYIDSTEHYTTPYYLFLFGRVENLDSTYGFCKKQDFIGKLDYRNGFAIGKSYWLLLERRPNRILYYSKTSQAWLPEIHELEDGSCRGSALRESSFYQYYIIDWGECK